MMPTSRSTSDRCTPCKRKTRPVEQPEPATARRDTPKATRSSRHASLDDRDHSYSLESVSPSCGGDGMLDRHVGERTAADPWLLANTGSVVPLGRRSETNEPAAMGGPQAARGAANLGACADSTKSEQDIASGSVHSQYVTG